MCNESYTSRRLIGTPNIIRNISNYIPNNNININEYYILEFRNRNCYYFYILVSLYMFFVGTFCTVYNIYFV